FSIVGATRRGLDAHSRGFYLIFLITFAVLTLTQLVGQASLQLHYYASALVPGAFLALAALLRGPLAGAGAATFAIIASAALLPLVAFSQPLHPLLAQLQRSELFLPLAILVAAAAVA